MHLHFRFVPIREIRVEHLYGYGLEREHRRQDLGKPNAAIFPPSPRAGTMQLRGRAERGVHVASTFWPNGARDLYPTLSSIRTVKRRERRAPPASAEQARAFPFSTELLRPRERAAR